jgi:riboflavin biosynthesis pyrimidine reductase
MSDGDQEPTTPSLTRADTGATIAPDPAETELRHLYHQRPSTVRLGLIRSSDGKAAGPDGSSRTLNGPEDLRILVTLRSWADVILVGAQTARRERYGNITLSRELQLARSAHNDRELPMLAVVTRSGNLPPDLDPETTWLITSATAPAMTRLSGAWRSRLIIAGGDQLSPRTAIQQLEARGMSRVLCEGGPELATALLARRVITDYCITQSPHLGGADAPAIPDVPAGFRRDHRLEGGGFAMERWSAA